MADQLDLPGSVELIKQDYMRKSLYVFQPFFEFREDLHRSFRILVEPPLDRGFLLGFIRRVDGANRPDRYGHLLPPVCDLPGVGPWLQGALACPPSVSNGVQTPELFSTCAIAASGVAA